MTTPPQPPQWGPPPPPKSTEEIRREAEKKMRVVALVILLLIAGVVALAIPGWVEDAEESGQFAAQTTSLTTTPVPRETIDWDAIDATLTSESRAREALRASLPPFWVEADDGGSSKPGGSIDIVVSRIDSPKMMRDIFDLVRHDYRYQGGWHVMIFCGRSLDDRDPLTIGIGAFTDSSGLGQAQTGLGPDGSRLKETSGNSCPLS